MKIQSINSNNFVKKELTSNPSFGDNVYASIDMHCANLCKCSNFVTKLREAFTAYAIKLGKITEDKVVEFIPMPEADNRLGLYLFDGTTPQVDGLIKSMESAKKLIHFLDKIRDSNEVSKVKFVLNEEQDSCLFCGDLEKVQPISYN